MFSDSALCVGVSKSQIHPVIGKTRLEDVCHETCSSFGTYYQVLPLCTARFIFRGAVGTGKLRNPLMRGSSSCLCSTTLDGVKKGKTETCLHKATEVAAFATHFKPGTLVLPGARVRKYVVERKFQRTSRKMRCCPRGKWLTFSSVTLPTRHFKRQSHHRLDS